MMKTDLIIIGAGPGGYRAAEYAAKNGLQVVIAEAAEVGGTCLNCGCIPTKTLCHHAELIDSLRQTESNGLKNLQFEVDFPAIAARKQQVVNQLRTGVETLLSQPGITLVRGKAQFKDDHTVIIGEEEYTAENIIIATGSEAALPPFLTSLPLGGSGVGFSTELLNIDHIPERLCIVGAGVIGMEFASAFSSFGSQVTVIEYLKECLPPMDGDLAKRLRKTLEKRGVEFYMQSAVKQIDGHTVIFERKGKEQTIEADTILIATGRRPRTEGLNLAAAGIECTPKGAIPVDENFRVIRKSPSSGGFRGSPPIYAIGDVNGLQMLAHAATFQGFHAVNNILGKSDDIDFTAMPAAVFTNPEVAGVGPTEEQLKASSDGNYICKKAYYRANGKALAMDATDGLVKLLAHADGRIVACHVMGAHAADIVQEATALIHCRATLSDLAETIHIHPTLAEILHDAALN
ncbi:MAG: dihydrolipoyl dehydrogenase [Prevotella sp.]|nr:dihydrolipoyl dehydrogenase [Prevotella sp.]